MYCPSCGSEERQISQFCRACGKDLRAVRLTLEKPDAIAASAREEIGRAVADKIRDLKKASDLSKVAEEVLPQLEQFLESPQHRRLRGIRQGVVMTMIGVGATVFFFLMGLSENDTRFLIGIGVTAFLIGIGLILNALLFTVPRDQEPEGMLGNIHRDLLKKSSGNVIELDGKFSTADPLSAPSPITEQTTHHLAGSTHRPSGESS